MFTITEDIYFGGHCGDFMVNEGLRVQHMLIRDLAGTPGGNGYCRHGLSRVSGLGSKRNRTSLAFTAYR